MNNKLFTEEVGQDIPGGGFALGYQGDTNYMWSRVTQQVVAIPPAGFSAMRLKATFGARWCNAHYTVIPEQGDAYFDHQRMADDIMAACQDAGVYHESKQRATGTWLAEDGGLVCNSDVVFSEKGEVQPRIAVGSKYVMPVGKTGLDLAPDDAHATPNEVLEFERALDAWEWSTMSAAALVLGWIACAVFAGALTWRAHLYITGRAGAGKSTLARLLGAVFGRGAARPTGQLTQAGLLQILGARAIPCIVDETEAGKSNRSTLAALEVARWASSMTESDDGVLRGTAQGKSLTYRVFSPFLFLGINLPKLEHADQSRAVTLEMTSQRRSVNGTVPRLFSDERYCAGQGRKLRRLAIARWSVFQAALPLFRQGITSRKGTARQADTYGSLIAGYWCLKSAELPTAADVSSLTECLQLPSEEDVLSESDEVRCLDLLLYSKVTVPLVEQLGEFSRSMTVADAIQHYCAAPKAQWRLERALQNFGVRILDEDGVWKVAIASSPEHKELQRFFAGSPWKNGCWSLILRRMPGGRGDTQRLASRASKVTLFNVPEELLPELRLAA